MKRRKGKKKQWLLGSHRRTEAPRSKKIQVGREILGLRDEGDAHANDLQVVVSSHGNGVRKEGDERE